MSYQPRNALVTGGAGFIGSNFVRMLLENDTRVRVVNLDRLTYAGSLENLEALPDPARHHFVRGDICDRELVERLLDEYRIDTVIHFAAESHVDRSIDGPEAFVTTNVLGTFTLLDACRRRWLGEASNFSAERCRFHHISTDEVYGSLAAHDLPFTESTAYAPNSPYSASKAGSDHLVRAYHHTYGLPVTTSNCSNNYGPRQHPEKFMPTVIRSCLEGVAIPVYGSGRNVRDWLHVRDHCRGIVRVLSDGRLGETYNIGGENEWANIDIANRICSVMDELRPRSAPHHRLIDFVADRPGHDWRYAIDGTRIRSELQWRPQQDFTAGLTETCRWYLSRPMAATKAVEIAGYHPEIR